MSQVNPELLETIQGEEDDQVGEDTESPDPNANLAAEVRSPLETTPAELKRLQQEDTSLARVCERLDTASDSQEESRVCFYQRDGLIYRCWRPQGSQAGDVRQCEQLVLPRQCRQLVLHLAHNVHMAGHLGITKTKDRVLRRYYWPGIFRDIAEYCRACEVCQRSVPRRPARAPMILMPLIPEPFQRITIDLVGQMP